MKTTVDIAAYQLKLLGNLDLLDTINAARELFAELWSPAAMAFVVWDPDMERFTETEVFGVHAKTMSIVAADFSETESPDEKLVSTLDLGSYEDIPADMTPLRVLRIDHEDELRVAVLLAGVKEPDSELEEALKQFPLGLAMANTWEIREIKRENDRLRNQHDQLEDEKSELTQKAREMSGMEGQIHKLISDLKLQASLRMEALEREKTLYEISSAVRSSVEIKEVLQKAVNSVGGRYKLARCVFFRMHAFSDNVLVFEYHDKETPTSRELFTSDEGRTFVQTAMKKLTVCDLAEAGDAVTHGFEPEFLKKFNFVSALLVPVVRRDTAIGQLFLQSGAGGSWSIDAMSFFGALADQLSVAVENADLHEEKKQQAVTDGLTGIANRRYFNEVFAKEFERARRYAEPLSLVVFDLDFLKKINDTYGHTAGDDAIKAIAQVLSNSSRSIDVAARFGGEEFCLLLPNTPLEESVLIAERIRKLITEVHVEGPGSISSSIGIANFPLHSAEPEELFKRADEALYKAKQGGRNRVCVFDET